MTIQEYSIPVRDSDGDTTVLRLRAKSFDEAAKDAERRGWTVPENAERLPPEAIKKFHEAHPVASTGAGVALGLFAFVFIAGILMALAYALSR